MDGYAGVFRFAQAGQIALTSRELHSRAHLLPAVSRRSLRRIMTVEWCRPVPIHHHAGARDVGRNPGSTSALVIPRTESAQSGEDLAAGQVALKRGITLAGRGGLTPRWDCPSHGLPPVLRAAFSRPGMNWFRSARFPRKDRYDGNRYTIHAMLTRLGVRGHRYGRGARRSAVARTGVRRKRRQQPT